MTLSLSQFQSYAKQYSGIILSKDLVFDTNSPLSIFHSFKDEANSVFLEGVSSYEHHSRYSYLAIDSYLSLICEKDAYTIIKNKNKTRVKGTVYEALSTVLTSYTFQEKYYVK